MPAMKLLVGIVILGLVTYAGYQKYRSRWVSAPSADAPPAENVVPLPERPQSIPSARQPPASQFRCDGRTHCSQMTSCAEATYFLRNCPNTQMDGDNDGVPCERQWCK